MGSKYREPTSITRSLLHEFNIPCVSSEQKRMNNLRRSQIRENEGNKKQDEKNDSTNFEQSSKTSFCHFYFTSMAFHFWINMFLSHCLMSNLKKETSNDIFAVNGRFCLMSHLKSQKRNKKGYVQFQDCSFKSIKMTMGIRILNMFGIQILY